MNYRNYIEKKSKGLAEIIRAGGGYAFVIKRFSPDDGSPLDPEIEAIDVEALKKEKENLQQQIEDINAILREIKNL